MIRHRQKLWIEEMSQKHRPFRMMMKVCSSDLSKEGYGYKIKKFMRFCHESDHVSDPEAFDELLKIDIEPLTDLLIDYVDFQRNKGDSYGTVSTALTAPEAFFDMNRRTYHKKVVRRSNQKDDSETNGSKPITDEAIFTLFHYAKTLRNKLIVSLLGSTGIRPAGLVDPVLRIKHLVPLPDISDMFESEFSSPSFKIDPYTQFKRFCYGIKVYDKSKSGYWAFLTPEASDILDQYFEQRKNEGEKFTEETPIISTYLKNKRWNTKYDYLTDDNMKSIMRDIIRGSGIKREKIGRNHDLAVTYMFRKRFNGHLKMNNKVNSNIAEKLLNHKRGLDGIYLQPTMEECYVEFFKAIPKLTIDPNQRHHIEIVMKNKKIDKLKKIAENSRKSDRQITVLQRELSKVKKQLRTK